MSRLLWLLLWMFILTSMAEAQVASTLHVFPQVADGKFADGTAYRSHFIVSNVTSAVAASCTIRLYGLPADRLSPATFTLGLGSGMKVATTGLQVFASGYA